MSWDPRALPHAVGKTVMITGANAGIGYFASEQLAAAGAHVILGCRSPERAEAAVAAIRRRVPGAIVEATPIDVSDPRSVTQAAETLLERDRLDVLMLNAGIVHPPATRATDARGNELVLSTNVIGHFQLAALTMPLLARSAGARVVSLGSLATLLSRFPLDGLQLEKSYTSWTAYAQSKIALQVFGFELDRRLRASGTGVSSLVVHPGYSTSGRTPGIRGVNHPSRAKRFADNLQAAWTQGKDRGAWSAVRAAIDPDAAGGQFYGPRFVTKGEPALAPAAPTTRSPRVGARLWTLLEEYSGQTFELSSRTP
ncbi:SDR family NAD(P)-dependent oxidoreductase [Leifsonia sp. NPDC058248]|uniref:SDR family NAD(P)-dependent oxidoreductase n=1 Tax=Leifsonia sp. NPDC058248 TaxID=3346402 RepID=UPI0036DBB28C